MTKKNGAGAMPSARTDVAEEWVGQEIFIYDHQNGDDVYCLNSGAALIWLLCDGSRDVDGIAGELTEAFGLPKAEVLVEVSETVGQFEVLNLVTARTAPKERRAR